MNRYIVICQPLALNFKRFFKVTTFVNVCQRCIYERSIWRTEDWGLSTLSILKCVHIIFR